MSDKFFEASTDLVAASMQAVRVLHQRKDMESRMVCDNLIVALRKMGVHHALKQWERKDVA